MKGIKVISIVLLLALLFTACGTQQTVMDISGKLFLYEKEGFGGDFNIYFNTDGTFSYYEGFLSSYIGMGTYTVSGDVVTLTDTGLQSNTSTFCFRIGSDSITFIAERSDRFTYMDIPDGGQFNFTEIGEE